MARVAREMVEKAGVDVDQLLKLLVKNAAAELTTFYYYTILRVNLIGLEGEGIKEIAETARIEDRNHFEALVPRIYELGGKLPDRWQFLTPFESSQSDVTLDLVYYLLINRPA